MPRQPFKNFYLCHITPENKFIKTDIFVKAKDSLSGAKKLYRMNKSLEFIYVLDEEKREVLYYETKHFFKIKKSSQLTR